MGNTFFQFKKFTIHQQLCAMKVSTDACIFGAAVAKSFAAKALQTDRPTVDYLDIGTGTGLLSLMVAQKTTAPIDAIEIDAGAYQQAKENVEAAPFKARITVYKMDVLLFKTNKKYDGIYCNPPFYEHDLRSADAKKNAAKHDTTLTLQQLAEVANSLLKPDGVFTLLLPYHRVNDFIKEALLKGLYLSEIILVRHSALHPYFRGILFFTKTATTLLTKELIIKNEDGTYTDSFIDLLRDYYLHL